MQKIKGLAPFGILALACLPCVALAVGVTGGAMSAVGGAFLTPAVGIPLLIVGLILVAFATALWRRRRACALPSGERGRGAAESDAAPLVSTRAKRAAARRAATGR